MEDRKGYSQEIPMQEAMKIAASDEGKKLFATLQEQHGELIQTLMAQAQSGNFDQVKQTLSGLLNSPEGKSLREQLRGQKNG